MNRIALIAAAILSFGSQVFAAPFPARTIVIKPLPAAKTGPYGWQPIVKTAQKSAVGTITVTLTCPDSHPRAASGEYTVSPDQLMVVSTAGSGNMSTPSNSAKWTFSFYFPNLSTPNTSFAYSVYCADKDEPAQISVSVPAPR